MTIRSSIDARALNRSLTDFEGVDDAPDGSYEQAKSLRRLIGDSVDQLMKNIREMGLCVDTCDGIREVEAVIYGYIKDANPDHPMFPTAEGFGAAMSGPVRDRVLSQTACNLAFLRERGIVQ
ncbi:MAG: hypothetical protein QJR02_02025 [Sinobacteraceae bacterium]|nr:hypothetical protein [Nevskiaceae bacterium]